MRGSKREVSEVRLVPEAVTGVSHWGAGLLVGSGPLTEGPERLAGTPRGPGQPGASSPVDAQAGASAAGRQGPEGCEGE